MDACQKKCKILLKLKKRNMNETRVCFMPLHFSKNFICVYVHVFISVKKKKKKKSKYCLLYTEKQHAKSFARTQTKITLYT